VVCAWRVRFNGSLSRTDGHAGLLVLTTDKPWDGRALPFKNLLNKENFATLLNYVNYLASESFPSSIKTKMNKMDTDSDIDLTKAESLTIQEHISEFVKNNKNNSHVPRLELLMKRFNRLKWEPQDGVEVTKCISTTTEMASNFQYEFSTFGRPLDWVVIPESVNGSPGVNIDTMLKEWDKKSRHMNAFSFKAEIVENQNLSLEDLKNRAAGLLDAQCEQDYFLFKIEETQNFWVAYKNTKGEVTLYQVEEPEKTQLLSKKIRYYSEINRRLECRDVMQNIAAKLPDHTPIKKSDYDKAKYNMILNNCSHLVRETLTHSGVNLSSLFSSPGGLMKECYEIQGKCSPDLLNFVCGCINRMERDDVKYAKKNGISSEKLTIFKQLKKDLQNIKETDNISQIEARVEEATKLHRGLRFGTADTHNDFKEYCKEYKKRIKKSNLIANEEGTQTPNPDEYPTKSY
jgi:hypothetical protein